MFCAISYRLTEINVHILIYLRPSAVAISLLIPQLMNIERHANVSVSPVLVKISHSTAEFISLMEHFTQATYTSDERRRRGEKNDPTFLNTLGAVTFS